ncbi:DUF2335 domain-containing protein [Macellibacteroides fermentans]|uniref:DUF2335 domain-containing protein n=1 Tax=Macellibacteroides fermentans TaxID=879969 RepID=UPI00406C668F
MEEVNQEQENREDSCQTASSHDLEKQELDVLKHLEEEGIDLPTNVTEVLESLPEDKRKVLVRALYAIESSSSFRGPLPPPEILNGYESVLPGASERILKMAEKQQEHRIDVERMIVDRQTKQSGFGQIWGGCLAVLFGVIACILGYTGHDWLAGIIATSTIIGLATIFVLNRKAKESEKGNEE